jgi:alpha-L-rhamnosidase
LNFCAAADRFADFAEALEKSDDAKWSRDLANRIKDSVVSKYYDAQKKTFGNGTHDSLALAFDIVEAADRKEVAASLAKVYQENGKKFDGGFMSYFIYPQLTKYGYVDLALDMLRNPDYPGIAQSIRDYDATTIFERFRDDSRLQQLRQSLDHHAMNHPTAWMLNDLAGIRVHPDHPGGQRLLLAPRIPKDLQRVKASVRLSYGLVESAWEQKDVKVSWSVTVPANTLAEVSLDRPVGLLVDGKEKTQGEDLLLNSGRHELQWSSPSH